eukprot:766507-Hanusia_phi.AAC.4
MLSYKSTPTGSICASLLPSSLPVSPPRLHDLVVHLISPQRGSWLRPLRGLPARAPGPHQPGAGHLRFLPRARCQDPAKARCKSDGVELQGDLGQNWGRQRIGTGREEGGAWERGGEREDSDKLQQHDAQSRRCSPGAPGDLPCPAVWPCSAELQLEQEVKTASSGAGPRTVPVGWTSIALFRGDQNLNNGLWK